MTTQGELAMRLLLHLDDDEAAARPFERSTWQAEPSPIGVILVDGEPLIEGHVVGLTEHIARHDPARVLREVASIRAIIDLCMTETDATGGKPLATRILRHLAAIYGD